MIEKEYKTALGNIHYWMHYVDENRLTLVFLPGLTADHRLFEAQVSHFKNQYNIFVWDAPGHGVSWPFSFAFDLEDKAKWLHDILEQENVKNPVIVDNLWEDM